MKINLSDYKNLCKDKRQPIIVSQDRKSDCQHRAQNVVKQNNLRSAVRQYKIDGNIIIDGNKCNYLVLNDDLKTAYLIELKGKDIHDGNKCDYLVLNDNLKTAYLIELKGKDIHHAINHAINQLDDTFNIMKSNLSDYTFFLRIVYKGKCTHAVRDYKTTRWKYGHGKSKAGVAIADIGRSPYEENI